MMYTLEDVVRVAETLPKDQVNGWWNYVGDDEFVRHETRDVQPSAFCSYEDKHDPSKPSCVAGTIVFALNPELFQQLVNDGGGWDSVQICGEFDSEANYFLERAQTEADRGLTWGDAITEAKARHDAEHI